MLLSLLLISWITFSESCTKIVVTSSNPDIDWLDGTFLLDPTLVADGRPVYVEQLQNQDPNDPDSIPRSIYHYSHEHSNDIADYVDKDFSGRWIFGNSMYSANGWYYIESWSISPSNNMMQSLVDSPQILNTNNDGVHPKLQWRVHINNEWIIDTVPHITLSCDTTFDDITKDWLFITTPHQFEFNILTNDQSNSNTLSSITETNVYGFYYRISDEYWRKIESKIFFRKRTLMDNIEYSFILSSDFTNDDGTPNMDTFSGYKIITNGSSDGDLMDINNNEWIVVDTDNRRYQLESISVDIVMSKDDTDNIYSAFRRYWRDIKLKSFNAVTQDLSETQRDLLIVDQNNGLPFMMLGLGTGGLQERAAQRSMQYAFDKVGYRVIDGAQLYENEGPLGVILDRKRGNTFGRNDLFIISKVWPTHLGFIQTYQAILASLNKIKTNYIDLYMIHWNRCNPDVSWMHCERASNRPWGQSWQIMEKLYAEGYLLSIGISNYDFGTFNEMLTAQNMQILPQVLQNYFDVSHADWQFAEYVKGYGVIYQGYAQYRGIAQAEERAENGEMNYKIFKDKLEDISVASTEGNASASQVLLKWLIQKNIAVIPRSTQFNHLKENWNIWEFQLTQNDMDTLTQLSIDQNKRHQKGEL